MPLHRTRRSSIHRSKLRTHWGKLLVASLLVLCWFRRSPIVEQGYRILRRPSLVPALGVRSAPDRNASGELRFVEDKDQDEDEKDERALKHLWLKNGLLGIEQISFIHHPIWELIQSAENQWDTMVEDIPKTPAELLEFYEVHHEIAPPPQLEELFEFSETIPPIFYSPGPLEPYLSIHPSTLHKRQKTLEAHPLPNPGEEAFVLVVQSGKLSTQYPWGKSKEMEAIAKGLRKRLEKYKAMIPDLRLTFTTSSLISPQILPNGLLERSLDLVDQKRRTPPDDVYKNADYGWAQVCPPMSDLHLHRSMKHVPVSSLTRADRPLEVHLIYHPPFAVDPCRFPKIMRLYSTYTHDHPVADTAPVPRIAASKLAIGGEILLPLTRQREFAKFVPWESKLPQESIYWRGSPPALPLANLNDEDVPLPQPYRLMLQAQNPLPQNYQRTFYPPTYDSTEDEYGYFYGGQSRGKVGDSNELWESLSLIDAAFTSKIPCQSQEGCGDFAKRFPVAGVESLSKRKFVLILDEESPLEAMQSGTVVFYASVVLQPWQQHAVPWKHYVPIQPDFSDLASALLFFRRYENEAEVMAENAAAFAAHFLDEAVETKSIVGLLMEWGRIWTRPEDELP